MNREHPPLLHWPPSAAGRGPLLARITAALARGADLAQRVWKEVWADEILDRAAALSYYLVFAMFPALLFLTALVGFLPWPLMDQLMGRLDETLPSDIVHKTFVEIAGGARGGILSLGIAVAFWAASSGMAAVMSALNAVYDIEDHRPWWRRRLVAFGLTLGCAVFAPAALILFVFGEQVGGGVAASLGLGPVFAFAWNWLRWPAAIALAALGIGLVYQFAPASRPGWRWMSPGALFAVAGWAVMSLGLRFYVTHLGNYSLTYGSIAGVMVTLLWLYLTSLALLVGAEIDAELRPRGNGQKQPGA